jgi:hypothetical protein
METIDINQTFSEIAKLFKKHSYVININDVESFNKEVITMINYDKTNELSIALDKINEKIIPKQFYMPYEYVLVSVLVIFMENNNNRETLSIRVDGIIKVIENDWNNFEILLKNLYNHCSNTIDDFKGHFKHIQSKDMCLKILNSNKIFYDNLNFVRSLVIQFTNPELGLTTAKKFMIIISLIVIHSKRYLLNDIIDVWPEEVKQVSEFFINSFLQFYKIRLSDLDYQELHTLLIDTRPLDLIEVQANVYLTLILDKNNYNLLMTIISESLSQQIS